MLTGSLTPVASLKGMITTAASLNGGLTIPEIIRPEIYRGPAEFTPSSEVQTIEIANMTSLTDITINPIPENYGLITWNGSTLTVS